MPWWCDVSDGTSTSTASMTNNRRTYKRKRPIRDTVRATPDCKGYSLANHERDVTVTVVG